MTVKDIIKLVCEFVGEKDLREKLCEENAAFTDRMQEKLVALVRCFNLVNQEIASEYLPFLTTENVEVNNSVLNFSDLSKTVINIYDLKNRFGMNLKFKLFPNYVQVFGSAKSVTYSYLPEELILTDEVKMLCGLSARVYAYGIASEYLLIDGMSEDADIWEERFKQSLFVLSRRKGEHVLPKRSWL